METSFSNFGKLNTGEVKKGDYVILNDSTGVKNIIGQVLRIRKHYDEIDIQFDEPIGKIHGWSLNIIKHWCSDKEKLELLINTKKYNL